MRLDDSLSAYEITQQRITDRRVAPAVLLNASSSQYPPPTRPLTVRSHKAKFHYAIQLAIQLASWSQTWFPTRRRQVPAISACRDSSNLVADRFAARVRPARELVCDLLASC